MVARWGVAAAVAVALVVVVETPCVCGPGPPGALGLAGAGAPPHLSCSSRRQCVAMDATEASVSTARLPTCGTVHGVYRAGRTLLSSLAEGAQASTAGAGTAGVEGGRCVLRRTPACAGGGAGGPAAGIGINTAVGGGRGGEVVRDLPPREAEAKRGPTERTGLFHSTNSNDRSDVSDDRAVQPHTSRVRTSTWWVEEGGRGWVGGSNDLAGGAHACTKHAPAWRSPINGPHTHGGWGPVLALVHAYYW